MPLVTTATFFPPPATTILNPTPLATLIVPLPARDRLRRQFESVLVAVLRNAIAYNDQRIADCACDREDFEIRLGKITERVEVVHLVLNKKKRVLGIVGDGGGADDHAGGVCAIAGNAVRGAGVATKRAQISDRERWLGADMNESAGENDNDCKRDLCLHVRGSVVVAANLRLAKKTFMHKHECEKSKLLEKCAHFNFGSRVDSV